MSEETVAQQASTTPRTPRDSPKSNKCWSDPSFKLFGKTIPMNNNNNNNNSSSSAAATVAEDANDDSGSSDLTNANVDPAPAPELPPKKPSKVLACPRCDSNDTKFCYYNNYNVNQPRHFCRNCQRYWTAGGLLRNVPVGSGRRKNKQHPHQHQHQHQLHRQPQQNDDDAVSASVPAAPPAVAPSDCAGSDAAAEPPATTEPSAAGDGDAAKLAAGDDAKFSRVSVPDLGYYGYGSTWMNNSVGAGVSQMWPLFHGGFLANSTQARPDPWSQIQGASAVFAWPIPWPMPPAWGMNMNMMAARPVTDPCASAVVLGKHGRAEDAEETGKNHETQATCLWMPKTLRIDHPEEAAKSSIWSTLGLVPKPESFISSSSSSSNSSSSTSSYSTAGIFRAFHPKSEMGADAAQVQAQTRSCTATDAQQHQKEHPCAELLRANPAASSRSSAFNEGAG